MSFRSCLYAVTLFAATSAMGQILDLSGVWLQEQSAYPDQELADPAPIVMEIHQTPIEMLLMSHQNGAQLSFHFDLSGQPTTREPGGYNPRLDRAKIKGGKLLNKELTTQQDILDYVAALREKKGVANWDTKETRKNEYVWLLKGNQLNAKAKDEDNFSPLPTSLLLMRP